MCIVCNQFLLYFETIYSIVRTYVFVQWSPMWRVESLLLGLRSFMAEDSPTTGSLQTSDHEKRRLAHESISWNLQNPKLRKMFPSLQHAQAPPHPDEQQTQQCDFKNHHTSNSNEADREMQQQQPMERRKPIQQRHDGEAANDARPNEQPVAYHDMLWPFRILKRVVLMLLALFGCVPDSLSVPTIALLQKLLCV